MDWIQTFRNSKTARDLATILREMQPRPMRLMEVCGTHTVAIAHNGIRDLMPEGVTLTSGPGCPVCVTAISEIDLFLAACRIPKAIITTFGDLIKVPGSRSSLAKESANGTDIRIVYSALDALAIARANPGKEVIFLGVGFETTTPTIAASILQAEAEGLTNFSVISAHKLMPPALTALIADEDVQLDGLLCPGHVSIMIGADAYKPFAEELKIPCVIAGFEAADILHAIVLLVRQVMAGEARVEISYQRAVYEKGNAKAMAILETVFEPCPADWRGIGTISASGLKIRAPWQRFDAVSKFSLEAPPTRRQSACQCGEVLKGIIMPPECRLFAKACRPEQPIGPCMVSSEGACAAFYRYKR